MSAYKGPDGQEDMPYLLTPGPVTTSRGVKFAMLADYGQQDPDFVSSLRFVRNQLVRVAGGGDVACVLLQGPGQFAIEAAIGSLCPARRKKTLVVVNGADGEQAARIMERIGRPCVRLTYRESSVPRESDLEKALTEDKSISHVWLAHCETSTGMLNPLEETAAVVKRLERNLIVDARMTFAGAAIDMQALSIEALITQSDGCLESVPGLSMVLARHGALEAAAGQSHSHNLDLHSQWQEQEAGLGFLATPPTHTVMALREALQDFENGGGVQGRAPRYRKNAAVLRERLKAMGLQMFLPDTEASPIVQTVLAPRAATFEFIRFQKALHTRGFAIAPGALSNRASFRIGNIGPFDDRLMQQLVSAMEDILNDMDVRSFAPADS